MDMRRRLHRIYRFLANQPLRTILKSKILKRQPYYIRLIVTKTLRPISSLSNKRAIKKRIQSQDSYLKQIMAFRTNTPDFNDKVPEKELIQEILKSAHELVPVKNDLYDYRIEVWGPEHSKEKRELMLSSYVGENYKFYRQFMNRSEDTYKELEEMEFEDDLMDRTRFNHQLEAPYLLVYYKEFNVAPTPSQVYKADPKFKYLNYNNKSPQWLISASMHAFGTTLLCAEKGLHAAFCRCYPRKPKGDNGPILHPLDDTNKYYMALMLSIGYRHQTDLTRYRFSTKPKIEEIVTWMDKCE